MSILKSVARAVIPRDVRYEINKKYSFWDAFRKFKRLPDYRHVDQSILESLIFGWGNADFSAGFEYARNCAAEVEQAKGPVVECGSGLSTLLAGAIADKTGQKIWSLESDQEWASVVKGRLEKHGIKSVTVCYSPLKQYPEFDWYDAPLADMPSNFCLALCDGPPGNTRGGRRGMVPVLRDRMVPGTTILLDDFGRPAEQEAGAFWAKETGCSVEKRGTKKPYAYIRMPG